MINSSSSKVTRCVRAFIVCLLSVLGFLPQLARGDYATPAGSYELGPGANAAGTYRFRFFRKSPYPQEWFTDTEIQIVKGVGGYVFEYPVVVRGSSFGGAWYWRGPGDSGWLTTGGWRASGELSSSVYTPPPEITSPLTASGMNGQAFAYSITATGTPTSWGSSGVLPDGISFNSGSGTFTGIAQETGTFEVLISATNAYGTDTETLVITIGGDPCAHLTDPPAGLGNQHAIDVPLKNETDQVERYRISMYRVEWTGWGRNQEDTDCVPTFASGGRVAEPKEYEVPPGVLLVVKLENGFPFEYEVEKFVIPATPDGGGTAGWEPIDAPTESWGEHAPTRGRSQAIPDTEGDAAQAPATQTGPPVVDIEDMPAPPAAVERPETVNDQASANAAAEARHTESQSALGTIADQVTKLLNQSKTAAAQASSQADAAKQSAKESADKLERIASRLEGGGHQGAGTGPAGAGHGPAGEGGENLPGSGGGSAGDWGGINPGSKLGASSGRAAPLFVIPFGALGIADLNDVPVDWDHSRFDAWREPVRAMLLAAIAVMMLWTAVTLVMEK